MTATRSLHVLLVDDFDDGRETLREYLEQRGCFVHAVATAAQALRALAEARFDVVVLEIELDALGGPAVLEAIRQRPGLPLIVLTKAVGVTEATSGVPGLAHLVVTKPADPPALLASMRALAR